jgi:transposase
MARPNMQSAHRLREKLMQQRMAKVNHIRGFVSEYCVIAPDGIEKLRQAIPEWLEDAENHFSVLFCQLLIGLADDLSYVDNRITELNVMIKDHVGTDPVQLIAFRGVGVLCATALSSAIGDRKAYRKGRDFAASLGLSPRAHGTGGKDRLLGISKRGDGYLRKLLVHGTRAVIRHAKDKDDYLSKWLNKLLITKHVNIVSVALANKIARIAWAMVAGDTEYQPNLVA